jgi:hypothetical protein
LAVTAVRLLLLRMLARHDPEAQANSRVPTDLVAILAASRQLAPERMRVRQFWHGVAQLRGFVGRAGDVEPGWPTLWAGWFQLLERLWGYHLALSS